MLSIHKSLKAMACLAAIGLSQNTLANGMSYKIMSESGGIENKSIDLFITGTLNGISWYNVMADESNKLYCPPEGMVLNSRNLWSLVAKDVEKNGRPNDPFGLVAIFALQETFPCK
jgi:hypothetical protein